MKRKLLFVLLLVYCKAFFIRGQSPQDSAFYNRKIKVSAGGTYGDDFTNLNIKYLVNTQTNAYEGRICATYRSCRFVANVEKVVPVNLKPGWLNVHATYYDLNISYVRPDLFIYLYPVFGVFVEQSSGFYTGQNYLPGMQPWIGKEYNHTYKGFNLGGGLEINLGKLSLFGEMRGRLMKADGQSICNEIFLTCGLRVDLFSFTAPHLHMRKLLRMPDKKYRWF